MPTGIIINVLSVAIGGIVGAVVKDRISESFKNNLTMIFALCSMAMGISSIVLMENMPAVVFSVILGTSVGLITHLGSHINRAAASAQKLIGKGTVRNEGMLVTVIVLFCASGTGIYGSIVSAMTGDHSILIAKSILDLFTAMIFACMLGAIVAVIAVPQFVIMILLFLLAGLIYPLTTPTMINDFKACGGFIMLATGFRMLNLKEYPTADMIPAMLLVMPLSSIWTNYVLPLLAP